MVLLIKSYQFQIRSLFLPFPSLGTFYVLIMTLLIVCMSFRKVLDIELELMAGSAMHLQACRHIN